MNSKTSAYKVEAGPLTKHLEVPTSKSHANRALIMAAILPGSVTVENLPQSEDVEWMIKSLTQIGLKIERKDSNLKIENSFPECETTDKTIHCGEGGTTTRFLAALLARGQKKYVLEPEGPMRDRPMDDLVESLKKLNVNVSQSEKEWLTIQGPYDQSIRDIEVSCAKSTQFASALAMALYDHKNKVVPTELHYSKDYWEMTLDLIKQKKKKHYRIPVDFSSLSYPIALAFVTGEVWVDNCLDRDIFQADASLVDYIGNLGGLVRWTNKALYVGKVAGFSGLDVDCSTHPDLVPTLAYIAAHAEGKSLFSNVKILRHKESDRIAEVQKILSHYGVENSYDEEKDVWTIVGGVKNSSPFDYSPPRDHRMVMTAYLFMRTHQGGTIEHPEYVKKSFTDFFDQMGA